MAKTGLNYYTIDTDRYQDRRIKRLKKDCGCQGMAVYDYILCEVYRVHGCFIEWDDDTAFDVAEYFGLKENAVREIVKYCGAVGLFDKELLSRGIITSAAIQRRYLDMCNRAKRRDTTIPEKYRIIPEEMPKITEETPIIPEVGPQSKVKESKVNNISLSLENTSDAAVAERERILEVFYFEKNCVDYFDEALKFINHYEADGWCKKGNDKPVKDRVALARSWKVESAVNRADPMALRWLRRVYDKLAEIDAHNVGQIMRKVTKITDVENAATQTFELTCKDRDVAAYIDKALLTYPELSCGCRLIFKIPKH